MRCHTFCTRHIRSQLSCAGKLETVLLFAGGGCGQGPPQLRPPGAPGSLCVNRHSSHPRLAANTPTRHRLCIQSRRSTVTTLEPERKKQKNMGGGTVGALPQPAADGTPTVTPPSPHIEGRGVTYDFLQRLTDARVTPELKESCITLLCRYVELSGCGDAVDAAIYESGRASVGDADAFVSWNWDSGWQLLLLSLEEHTRKAVIAGQPAPHYWLDLFAVNQHTSLHPWKCESGLQDCPGCAAVGDDMMSMEEMVSGRRDKGFERVINSANCRETLVLLEPWFSPLPTSRVWCLYEILLTIMAGKKITVMSPPQERAALSEALTEDLDSVQRAVGQISAETAEATMEGDRTMIFAAVVKLLPRGFLDLENMVKDRLREWTYEAGEEALAAMAPEERGTSKLINELALYFNRLGEYDRAEPLFEEALAARRRTLGDEDPSTLTSINNLGSLQTDKGDYAGAESLLEEALAASRRTLGDDHPHTLASIGNLGGLRYDKGDYAGAEPLLEEALAASRRTLGHENDTSSHQI